MIIEFKKYSKVKSFVNIDVKIILNDDVDNPVYEGVVEKAPKDLRERYYYKILMEGKIAVLYIYDDDVANRIINELKVNSEDQK